MQVQGVNNNQYSPSFNAKVEFIADSKKYLSKDTIKNITTRAKALGTDADNVVISIGEKPILKEEERMVIKGGSWLFGGGTVEKETRKTLVGLKPYVSTAGVFPTIDKIVPLQTKNLPAKGSVKANAGKFLDRYMGYLEQLFNGKA